MTGNLFVALQAAVLLLAGCGAGRASSRPAGVAVLKLKEVGIARETASRTRAAIYREIDRATDHRMIDSRRVDRAIAAEASCAETGPEAQERCALATGTKLGATHVVIGALGGLGATFIVQLRVVDMTRAAVTKSLEETRFGSPQSLPRAAGQLAVRLFERRGARPWYERWWVWTIAAAVVAGAAVAIPVAVTSRDPPYEDVPLP